MRVHLIDAVDARLAAARMLSQLLDGEESLAAHARSAHHTFLIAFADDQPDADIVDAAALVIMSLYEMPMASRTVLGVDALAIRSPLLDDVLELLRVLAGIATAAGLHGVLLADAGVVRPGLLGALAHRGRLDDEPVAVIRPWIMRRASAGLWSPFAGGPIPDSVFRAEPSLCVLTEDMRPDTAGVPYPGAGPLYRGEGRLTCAEWECGSPAELAEHLRRVGFAARSPADFGGTVAEQILHQGYVPQGTVSFSTSFDVCATYATHGHERPGVVFTVDADRLRARGPIWDAHATLVRHCDWFFEQDFATLREIIAALGVREAGRFLDRCYEGTRESCRVPHDIVPIDWDAYLGGGLTRLRAAGIEQARLECLNNSLETFWMRALGMVMAEDVLHVGGGFEERRLGVLGYAHAFREVAPRLSTEALAPPDPGWDLTAFGFVAKTCRDHEYFSSGPVPPDCIVAATIVG